MNYATVSQMFQSLFLTKFKCFKAKFSLLIILAGSYVLRLRSYYRICIAEMIYKRSFVFRKLNQGKMSAGMTQFLKS